MAELRLRQRSDTPAAVASNVVLFTDTDGNLNIRKPDGSILELAAAGNFTFTIPASGTPAMRNTVNTFTEAQTFSSVLTAPGMKPASNSTNALEFENAGGTPILTIDTTNSKVITSGDVFPNSDTSGLFARLVNVHQTPTDHFTATSLAGAWAWAGAPFAGAASGIDLAALPSILRLVHSSITDNLFLFQTVSASAVMARLAVLSDSYIGVRIDDGSTDNSIEFRVSASGPGLVTLSTILTTAGTPATTTIASNVLSQWFVVRVTRAGSTVQTFLQANGPALNFLSTTAQSWTPSRGGIVFGQRGAVSSLVRAGFVDWVALS